MPHYNARPKQYVFFFFFFSSRRRHTRSLRDWSSDVCSSDLCQARPADTSRSRRLFAARRTIFSQSITCCAVRSEEHTSELQSRRDLVCRLLLEKKKKKKTRPQIQDQRKRRHKNDRRITHATQ